MPTVAGIPRKPESSMRIFSVSNWREHWKSAPPRRGGKPKSFIHSTRWETVLFWLFFDDPETPFEFKDQRDFDLHIALEVEQDHLKKMFEIGKNFEMECRGISDHGFIDSIYFRDPNGYVIELTAKRPDHDRQMLASGDPRILLEKWNESKNLSLIHI